MTGTSSTLKRQKTIVTTGTAAGTALAALAAGHARASVVYTAVNEPVNSTTTTQYINFTNDGYYDASVYYQTEGTGYGPELKLSVSSNDPNHTAANQNEFISDIGYDATALSAGTSIGSASTFSAGFIDGTGTLYEPADTNNSQNGDFTAGMAAYIGFELYFADSTTPHYGYAEFETTDGSNTTTAGELLGYAYESTPGVAITTGAVPEPSSLAMLAMGAAGLSSYRGKRKR